MSGDDSNSTQQKVDHKRKIDHKIDGAEQVEDLEGVQIPVRTEAEHAERLSRSGLRVTVHEGRHWKQIAPGFWSPVHFLARLSAQEATRPTRTCLGFQACLDESDALRANAVAPLYMASDLSEFDEDALPSSRRYKLRKARRRSRLVRLTGPALLQDQGYDVLLSAHSRTQFGEVPTIDAYRESVSGVGAGAQEVVLAGLVDGRLAGYLKGYAVDGTGYVQTVVIASQGLSTDVGTGLTYEFVHACARTPGIEQLMHGNHAPEDEGLCRYKEWFGLRIRRVPSRVGFLPGIAPIVRRRRPYSYYRFTGTPPG